MQDKDEFCRAELWGCWRRGWSSSRQQRQRQATSRSTSTVAFSDSNGKDQDVSRQQGKNEDLCCGEKQLTALDTGESPSDWLTAALDGQRTCATSATSAHQTKHVWN